MNEYALLAASAAVSAVTNLLGIGRRAVPRRILVVKLDHLGDVITATPALRALREAHPAAEIDLLLAPGVAPLFEGSPLVSRVLVYDAPRFQRHGVGEGVSRPAARPLPPGSRYDTIVELRGDTRTLGLPFQAGAVRRLDRGTVRFGDWLARRFGRNRPPRHEVETNLEVIRPLLRRAADPAAARVEVQVPGAARGSVDRRLAAAGIAADQAIITVHPGAAWRPRAWAPERFAAIADWIGAHYDARIVLVGSEGERDVEAAVRSHVRGSVVSFFGVLSIAEVAALLQRSRLLIGNDSGIAHLAAACGTRVVALFGPQDPRRFAPWAPPGRVLALHHRVPCFPCAQVTCVRPERPCVNLIENAEVVEAVRALLGPAQDAVVLTTGRR